MRWTATKDALPPTLELVILRRAGDSGYTVGRLRGSYTPDGKYTGKPVWASNGRTHILSEFEYWCPIPPFKVNTHEAAQA